MFKTLAFPPELQKSLNNSEEDGGGSMTWFNLGGYMSCCLVSGEGVIGGEPARTVMMVFGPGWQQ